MKPFFGRIVTERPRSGSSNPSVKARRFGSIEDGEYYGPVKIPMSKGGKQFAYNRKVGDKDFTDLLGPIEGYLRSKVGQPWSKVYSELSRGLGRSTWPVRHILSQHVEVAVNTYRGADGKVWHADKTGGEEPVGGYFSRFYVEPETGLLREAERLSWRSWRRQLRPASPKQERRRKLADGHYAVLIGGIWYIGEYRFEPDPTKWVGFEPLIIGKHVYAPRFVGRRTIPLDAEWPDYRGKDGAMRFRNIKQANRRELKEIRKAQ